MHDGALGQQRRRVVFVDVLLHPVVVVAHAVEREDVVAPHGLEAHAHAGRMQVRLEGDDLGVLLQHAVGMDLLTCLIRLHVEIDAVAEPERRALVERLIALREELEAELELRLGGPAVRMDVAGGEGERRTGGQQASGLVGEDVGVAAHLVDRPRGGGLIGPAHHFAFVVHVVEHVASADGARGATARDVVQLAHFHRRHVAVFGETGRDVTHIAPPVGPGGRHQHLLRAQHQIGRADGPDVGCGHGLGRRQVGHVAERSAGIGPRGNGGNLLFRERRIALEALDADLALDEPRRHDAGAGPHAGAPLDRARPGAHVLIGHERHRRHAFGGVAVLATALQDRRDVLGEGDGTGRGRRWLRLGRRARAKPAREGHRAGGPARETPTRQRIPIAHRPHPSPVAAKSMLNSQRRQPASGATQRRCCRAM